MLDRVKSRVGELWSGFTNFDISRGVFFGPVGNVLRNFITGTFFRRPIMEGTVINYELARSLYRNDNPFYTFGAGFVRPIIDRCVEYMGLPIITTHDSASDTWLNECIQEHWAPSLQQAWRDAMRDSKCFVRYRQPRIDNPLFTEDDRMHGRVEVLSPETVQISWNPVDKDLMDRATVLHQVNVDERSDQEVAEGVPPRMQVHEIVEIITPQLYQYFDKTAGAQLSSWTTNNILNFIPLWEVWNEYESDLGGGQSDIEAVLPYLKAFHEVFSDAMSAHKYHSIPKAMFKIKDVVTFIKNNWPDAIDPTTGQIMNGAKINWQGKEIIFLTEDEDAGFVEAKSVLGDSKVLLDFIVEVICVTSSTPRWALQTESTRVQETDASVAPFEKKIERKRVQFQEMVVMMCKMALLANGQTPDTPRVSWPPVRLYDLTAKAQAVQQIIMGLDVAAAHEWISDETTIKILSSLFPEINTPAVEKALAANNVVPVTPKAVAAPAPAPTSTNGKGSKGAAQKALATTTPSNS